MRLTILSLALMILPALLATSAHAKPAELDYRLLKGFKNPAIQHELQQSIDNYWLIRERIGIRMRELADQNADFRKDRPLRELDARRAQIALRFHHLVPADLFTAEGKLRYLDEHFRWNSRSLAVGLVPSRLPPAAEALQREWSWFEAEFPESFQKRKLSVHYVIDRKEPRRRGFFVYVAGNAYLIELQRTPAGALAWQRKLIGRDLKIAKQGMLFDSFGELQIRLKPNRAPEIFREVGRGA